MFPISTDVDMEPDIAAVDPFCQRGRQHPASIGRCAWKRYAIPRQDLLDSGPLRRDP